MLFPQVGHVHHEATSELLREEIIGRWGCAAQREENARHGDCGLAGGALVEYPRVCMAWLVASSANTKGVNG